MNFREKFVAKKAQYSFPKRGQAVWKFSENSSNLVPVVIPKKGTARGACGGSQFFAGAAHFHLAENQKASEKFMAVKDISHPVEDASWNKARFSC